MGLKAKSGTLTQPGSTGNQSITGVGFTPKLVLLWMTDQSSAGTAAHASFTFGCFASDVSQEGSCCAISEDAAATTDTNRLATQSRALQAHEAAGHGVAARADGVSMDADGFTIDWVTVSGGGRLVHWLALGGNELEVFVGDFAKSTNTSVPVDQSVTGVGFQPDALILFSNRSSTSITSHAGFGIGFAVSGSEQAAAFSSRNGQATSDSRNKLAANALTLLDESSDALKAEGTLKTLDSDGFTLTWNTNDANAEPVFYIALKGAGLSFGVGASASPGSGTPPVAQNVTGVGFTPKVALFLTTHSAASASIQADAAIGFGVAVSASDQRCAGTFDADNEADSVAKQDHDDDACLSIFNGSGSIDAVGEFDGFTADGFDLSWTTLTVTSTAFAYLVISDRAPGLPETEAHVFEIPQDDRPGLRDFGFEAVGPDQYTEGLKAAYSGEASTLYRIADDDLARREIYTTSAAEPTEPADPDPQNDAYVETYTASPHTTALTLAVSTINKILVCLRNKYNQLSMNRTPKRIELDSNGDLVSTPPSAPTDVAIEAAAAGTFRITAAYEYLPDGDDAADTFLVYLTTGGGTPDPSVDVPVEVTMKKTTGVAYLDYTSGAVAHGVVGKVIVRTRKQGTPDVDSRNLDVYTATASTAGPAGGSGSAFFGAAAEQHD